eukprot:m.155763 g.155763  ORF g.155763 m.155763 type:complete len:292 (-) comp30953_c0_seq1:183-1058(-)
MSTPVVGKYMWHKLRNSGVDYHMILRERRAWLLRQDLARSELLLCEWFALLQELDNITREELGVDQFGTKVVTDDEENERRKRSRSFQNKSESDMENFERRPRAQSFLEFIQSSESDEGVASNGEPHNPSSPSPKKSNEGGDMNGHVVAHTPIKGSDESSVPGTPTNGGDGSNAMSTPNGDTQLDDNGSAKKKKVAFKKKKKDKTKTNEDVVLTSTPTRSKDGENLVVAIKKKKSKTPNKALKKMFKVVEKKASEKGAQPQDSLDFSQDNATPTHTTEQNLAVTMAQKSWL